MLLAQWNGVLAVWDLLRRQHEPALTMQVCEEPLLRMRMHEGVCPTLLLKHFGAWGRQSTVNAVKRFQRPQANRITYAYWLTVLNVRLLQGSLLACGSQTGSIYMIEVSHSLSQSDKLDKGLLTAVRLN